MHQSFGGYVCGMRGFWGLVKSKIQAFAVYLDGRLPLAILREPCDAKKTTRSIPISAPPILGVHGSRSHPKIRQSVVLTVPVYVVYLSDRKRAMNIEPSQSMRPICQINHFDDNVSIPVNAACQEALSPPRSAATPSEDAGKRVVVQDFEQARGSKIGSSQDAVPSLIGQRPVGVDSAARPRYFKAAS